MKSRKSKGQRKAASIKRKRALRHRRERQAALRTRAEKAAAPPCLAPTAPRRAWTLVAAGEWEADDGCYIVMMADDEDRREPWYELSLPETVTGGWPIGGVELPTLDAAKAAAEWPMAKLRKMAREDQRAEWLPQPGQW